MRTYSDSGNEVEEKPRSGLHLSFRLLMLLGVLLVLILAWPLVQGQTSLFGRAPSPSAPQEDPAAVLLPPRPNLKTPTLTATTTKISDTATPTFQMIHTQQPVESDQSTPAGVSDGVWVLAMRTGREIHLFAYHAATQPLVQLTTGEWQDISPAASPDGAEVAFASNRSGQWDLYTLNLATGKITQITNTPAYEAYPSWSPDGLWLTFETYIENNLDIYVAPLAGDQPAIALTSGTSADYTPAWSPSGRQIAFISDRSGEPEVWVANLDKPGEDQFLNLSRDPLSIDSYPTWSPDGSQLAWASNREGLRQIKQRAADAESNLTHLVGSGDWPVWSPDGSEILTRLPAPNQSYLISYLADQPGMVNSPSSLSLGPLLGLTWVEDRLPDPLPAPLRTAASSSASPLYELTLDTSGGLGDRRGLVDLEGVEAPYPQLHDLVDESFVGLRVSIAREMGWDLLASLENAFVPLTTSLPPGMQEDWLFTGRAFSFITSPIDAGWMAVVREDYGQETYWHVYGLTRFQDGSQGIPLHGQPWVFNTHNNSDINLYEQGGGPAESVPPGYWVDLTALANVYGWERVPALYNWRSFFLGSKLNEVVMRDGLDWRSAMLELYPPEVLITPTVIVPPTRTPTPTIRWWRTPTPSNTPKPPPTMTPSPSP